ncbi:hypothetical protein BJ165DRAFT_1324271, partial [Panaeolus papilionaceus]
AARRVRNGGMKMMMSNLEGALWIKTKGKKTFLERMGGTAVMKEKTVKVIVDFVPIEFNPEDEGAIRGLEEMNKLGKDSIASATYFKKSANRTNWQKTATLLVAMRSAEEANKLLEEGIWVDEEGLAVRKKVVEPEVCNNCQSPGHYAGKCPNPMCCSKCGGEGHNFRNCRNTAEFTYQCKNCGGKGHGPRDDRKCPWYIGEIRRLGEEFPCNNRRLFATDDPRT